METDTEPSEYVFNVESNKDNATLKMADVLPFTNLDNSVKCILSAMSEGDTICFPKCCIKRIA